MEAIGHMRLLSIRDNHCKSECDQGTKFLVSFNFNKLKFKNRYSVQLLEKLLRRSGITWIRDCTFSAINFVESKYRPNISHENLMSKSRHAISAKYTLDFKDLVLKTKKK